MGGHNRPYPSLRWGELDDKQMFARDARGPLVSLVYLVYLVYLVWLVELN
jgi:hypothetical protein